MLIAMLIFATHSGLILALLAPFLALLAPRWAINCNVQRGFYLHTSSKPLFNKSRPTLGAKLRRRKNSRLGITCSQLPPTLRGWSIFWSVSGVCLTLRLGVGFLNVFKSRHQRTPSPRQLEDVSFGCNKFVSRRPTNWGRFWNDLADSLDTITHFLMYINKTYTLYNHT